MSNLSRMIEMDHEVGKSNVPPKLLTLDDYYGWRDRFESYCRFHDLMIWECITHGYTAPTTQVQGTSKQVVLQYNRMNEEQKESYKNENRAHSCIKMCLPKEVNHLFKSFHTAKELWLALEKRCDGSPQMKEGKRDLLKKQFVVFKAFKGEELDAYITRFYHLLSELDNHKIAVNDREKINKFLEGLPQRWEMHGVMIKDNEDRYATMTLEDAIDKLRGYAFTKKTRDSDNDQVQDPKLYFGKASPSDASTSSTTALLVGDVTENNVELVSEDLCYIAAGSEKPSKTTEKSTQEHHKMPMSVKSAEQQLSVLASFVASYENYI